MDVYDAFETPRARRGELAYLRRGDAEAYLAEVRGRVQQLGLADDERFTELVLRHERQHNETMLQALALADLDGWRPPAHGNRPSEPQAASGLEMIDVPAASFPLGAAPTGFAYDNERPQHEVEVEAFAIGRVPVTNADWLAFIADGGYERLEWWSSEGWAWRTEEAAVGPLHWLEGGRQRSLDGVHQLEPAAPVVHVSYYEADAFARARGLRLPTEVEWELAASWDPVSGAKRTWPWGEEAPQPVHANLIESGAFAPVAAGALRDGAAPCGALGMIGDVWEWTASDFRGYPGFHADPYPEYSEVFFGGDYRVLRGGSFATSAAVVTATFRNWDYPRRRQIFAGLRVAADRR
jgi:iron(II)-dependent oxidoreductase